MNVLLIGASGTIGRAVAQLLGEQGHALTGVSRSTQPAVDFTDPASIDSLYRQVDELDAVVMAGGDAAFATLDQLTDAQIGQTLASKLMGQISLVRKGIARLRPGGVFVLTGGMLAYAPWPATSMVAMVNAGLEGFMRAGALEMTDGRRLVIVHPPLVAETAGLFGLDSAPWPSAAVVARTYREAVESGRNGAALFVNGYAPAAPGATL